MHIFVFLDFHIWWGHANLNIYENTSLSKNLVENDVNPSSYGAIYNFASELEQEPPKRVMPAH